MITEMTTLESNSSLTLVAHPIGKSTMSSRWVFIVYVVPKRHVDRLKARLMAKGYTHNYGLGYGDSFSLFAKMESIRLFLSMVVIRRWYLYQLDIKNSLYMVI